MPFPTLKKIQKAFTLAELLIALAILGVIATFTIPKVLVSQQNSQKNAIAKEAIGTISQAYQEYQRSKTPASATLASDLIQYLNYVLIDSGTLQIDTQPSQVGNWSCSSGEPCVRFHNGSLLFFRGASFGGTANTNAISFILDPDGKATGQHDSLFLILYFNGRITSSQYRLAGTVDSNGPPGGEPDPNWFSWN